MRGIKECMLHHRPLEPDRKKINMVKSTFYQYVRIVHKEIIIMQQDRKTANPIITGQFAVFSTFQGNTSMEVKLEVYKKGE